MAGYNWNKGMSNNAVDAYDNGEMPMSKWTKATILGKVAELADTDVADILSKLPLVVLREELLQESSWHHTSKYFNRTNFYSVNEDVSEMTAERATAAVQDYQHQSEMQAKYQKDAKRLLETFTDLKEGYDCVYRKIETEVAPITEVDGIAIPEKIFNFLKNDTVYSMSGNIYISGHKPTSETPDEGTARLITFNTQPNTFYCYNGWKTALQVFQNGKYETIEIMDVPSFKLPRTTRPTKKVTCEVVLKKPEWKLANYFEEA